MNKINVKLLAFKEAEREFYEQGKTKFFELTGSTSEAVEFVDENPEVLFVISGGSEQLAKQTVKPGAFYVLVSHEENNSNAAAFEIKAYLNQQGIESILLTNPGEIEAYFSKYAAVKSAIEKLKGKRIGLIGNVSDWLIASGVEKENLREKLGMELTQIDWKNLTALEDAEVNVAFVEKFAYKSELEKENASKIYNILNACVAQEKLDALTVECFPLVRQKAVTACLALSHFNDLNVPAGCEGDLASIVGMLFSREVCGSIPWMANVARIDAESTLFAHCTIGTNLLNDYRVTTHFETGLGTAIQGVYAHNDITIFRLNSALNKAFVSTGKVLERPQYATACRTQIEVKIADEGYAKLRNNPLGNHHLVLPGNQTENLEMACRMLGIELV